MPEAESQLTTKSAAAEPATALVRSEGPGNSEEDGRDRRLDRLPMELHVMVQVEQMRVFTTLDLVMTSALNLGVETTYST